MKRFLMAAAIASAVLLGGRSLLAASYVINFTFNGGPNPASGVVTFDASGPSFSFGAEDFYAFDDITNFTAFFTLGGVSWDESQMQWKHATPSWSSPVGDPDFYLTNDTNLSEWYWDDGLNGVNDQDFLRFVNGADMLYFDEGDTGSRDYYTVIDGQAQVPGQQQYRATSGIPEPTTLVIWGVLGLAGLGLRRWQRRR